MKKNNFWGDLSDHFDYKGSTGPPLVVCNYGVSVTFRISLHRLFCFSRNISDVNPKMIYFNCLQKKMDQSIKKNISCNFENRSTAPHISHLISLFIFIPLKVEYHFKLTYYLVSLQSEYLLQIRIRFLVLIHNCEGIGKAISNRELRWTNFQTKLMKRSRDASILTYFNV